MKYKGNEIVRKIIDSDFTCDGICGSECEYCPFDKTCAQTIEETRKDVLGFIIEEILNHGFDIKGDWIESGAMSILTYYTVDPRLWKDLGELYEEKHGKKWDERLKKLNVKEDLPDKKDSPGYYVFNRQGQSPRYVHDTYKSALEEAIRLSKKHHNNSFVVCQIKAEIKQEIKTFVEEY